MHSEMSTNVFINLGFVFFLNVTILKKSWLLAIFDVILIIFETILKKSYEKKSNHFIVMLLSVTFKKYIYGNIQY